MKVPGMDSLVRQAEAGRLPDALIRLGIRQLIRSRLKQEGAGDAARAEARQRALRKQLEGGPIAEHTAAANAQHYEAPPDFFREVLGPRMKYSACLWPDVPSQGSHLPKARLSARGKAECLPSEGPCLSKPDRSLAEAEERMLAMYAERAQLSDGMRVLDLGCGWGSFALWLGRRHPRSRILAVSNSGAQRRFIEARALAEGLENVEARTADINEFAPAERFDRIVSVEMFEHMRNYAELMRRISSWLVDDGRLFVHVFCHRNLAYPFEAEGGGDWMARHFFTGGIMPAKGTLAQFQEHMVLEETWEVPGGHYERTARAWLDSLDRHRAAAGRALAGGQRREARIRLQRWRMFFMACEELFGWDGGREWFVCHYRFRPRLAW